MKTILCTILIVAAFIAGKSTQTEPPRVTELEQREHAALYRGYVDALRDAESPAPIEIARHD